MSEKKTINVGPTINGTIRAGRSVNIAADMVIVNTGTPDTEPTKQSDGTDVTIATRQVIIRNGGTSDKKK
ncbi:hypothetical protein HC891_12420 [Candidatus Gracilibacteria bacterium]|nr:hypothetical protein [Candidatus Gracilibacteria bacterium]